MALGRRLKRRDALAAAGINAKAAGADVEAERPLRWVRGKSRKGQSEDRHHQGDDGQAACDGHHDPAPIMPRFWLAPG